MSNGLNYNETILNQIARSEKILVEANKDLEYMKRCIELTDFQGFYGQSFVFQSKIERLAKAARALPVMTGMRDAQELVSKTIVEGTECSVGFTDEGWFRVTIPSLLPKKEKGDIIYIRSTIDRALENYFEDKDSFEYTENCTIVFNHHYEKKRPEREYRDHDNIELNVVVDLIANRVLIDDHPLRLRHYYMSCKDDNDFTEVLIIPNKDFVKWITIQEGE